MPGSPLRMSAARGVAEVEQAATPHIRPPGRKQPHAVRRPSALPPPAAFIRTGPDGGSVTGCEAERDSTTRESAETT